MGSGGGFSLTLDNMNPKIKTMEYAVRGPIPMRAAEIEKELQQGMKKPFTEVIKANIGDSHAMGQVPISFLRQVLALVSYPDLLNDSSFPSDAKERAKTLLASCRGGSIGSYSDSAGMEIIRRHVAEYIQRRDGVACNWQDIVLGAGASDAIRKVLAMFICSENGKKPGVLIPIPQYPLYSASLEEAGMVQVGYYLDESNNWALDVSELQRAIDEARNSCVPRALVIINPGNPTGQVLSRKNLEEIVKFAHKERLFLFADEVYQDNIYTDMEFFSLKKVLTEMGEPYSNMELASFMSCSKGYLGECGLRGGYTEVINMCPKVKAMYLKAVTAMLCPTVLGQVALDVLVNPPRDGEPSFEQFTREKNAVLASLKLRAKMVVDAFNSFEGFSCNPVQGAMYAFPQIKLPPKAIEEAKRRNMEPDVFYAYELLENTGICIVPGSGFGQKPGTYHFRTTILPQPNKIQLMLDKFKHFHAYFIKQYN